MKYVYLHGFASGPQSQKALVFRDALRTRGIVLEIPDLVRGDFEHLTISGQLDVLERTVGGAPCRLIGSSMGGYVASLFAANHPEVDKLVLLAPAFSFAPRWREMQGPDAIADWKRTGWLEVFHYGDKINRRVHYGLLEDAAMFPASPDFSQQAMIFHGVNDTVVPVEFSRVFAKSHPNAELRELDSGHELTDVLREITSIAIPWLMA
jgi:pimeloyl-ACP methyl ester carboxylesterase